MFNEYFVSIFSSDSGVAYEHSDHEHSIEFENITILEEKVLAVTMNINNQKVHGPDNIPARLLKETAVQIASSLCFLFNKSLRVDVVPDEWKLANVVPVYKHGEKAKVENCRPISLLPLISKTIERCVFNNIKHHVYKQINSCQNGFVPKKSCITQLIEVLDHIGRELDRGKQIDVCYLDMSKAFDKRRHTKLFEFGFGGSILKWFDRFLFDQRLDINKQRFLEQFRGRFQYHQECRRDPSLVHYCSFCMNIISPMP